MTGRSKTAIFADSTQPLLISPDISLAALYGNGLYKATANQIRRFAGHMLLGVEGSNPSQAESMRGLDIERYDASPWDGPPFVKARNAAGHKDAELYGSLSTIAVLLPLLMRSPQWSAAWGLWVAWPWGRTYAPTRSQVAAQVRIWTSVPIPDSRIHACQWHWGVRYNTNIFYGTPGFTRPEIHLATLGE